MKPPRYPPKRRDADGNMLCRGCGAPVPPRRQTWCSTECYKTNCPREIVRELFKRDKGVCAHCATDTHALRKRVKQLWWDAKARKPYWLIRASTARLVRWMKKHGWPRMGRRWWEADHIIEFARGGSHRLENRQTLCVRCHKIKSAQFMKARRINGNTNPNS